ncbi:MAG: polysaccharide biosynthesis tyrosine autokinase [Rivularia sp. (in: cyanobacteria)]
MTVVVDTGLEHGQMVIASPQEAVNIRQLSTIIYRRRWLIFGVASIVMSVATLLSVVIKPMRESSMQMLVSSNLYQSTKNYNNQNSLNNDFTDSNIEVVDYTAQLQLMQSKKLIARAVEILHPRYPDITVKDIKGKKGEKAPLKVTQLQIGTGTRKAPSEVFEVSFKDKDPLKAKRVLEALQIVYQDFNKQQQKDRLSKGLAFVNERLPRIQQQVIEAETKLASFRKRNNIVDPQVQSTILLESIAAIKKQLDTTTAQLKDVQARYSNLEQKIAARPKNALASSRLSQSTRYQSLLDEIQKTELALAEERQRFTDNSPTVQKLVQQRQSQLALLQQEAGRSLGDKAAANNTAQPLLTKGQLAGVDLKLVEDLIKLQTEALGLQANQQSLMESERQLRFKLNQYPALIAEYNRLLPEVETSRKTLAQLMEVRQNLALKIAQGGFDWQILEEPELGTKTGSSRLLFLLIGAVTGSILGIAAALILELFNDTIYTAEELTKFTNLRLLGKIPKLPPPRRSKKLLGLPLSFKRKPKNPYSSFSEALAHLPSHETLDMAYQNIQILKYPLHCQSLMVTSASSGEGKSTSTLGLAVSAARMHTRVLVIDANLRNPCLHSILELSNDWGLSLLLLEEINSKVSDYVQPVHPAIDVLTAGPVPDDTVKLLTSGRMKELLEIFTRSYDLVLIDASSILDTVDARIIASLCNGIIMVGRIGKIKQTELIQATEILHSLNLVGIIANEATKSQKIYV